MDRKTQPLSRSRLYFSVSHIRRCAFRLSSIIKQRNRKVKNFFYRFSKRTKSATDMSSVLFHIVPTPKAYLPPSSLVPFFQKADKPNLFLSGRVGSSRPSGAPHTASQSAARAEPLSPCGEQTVRDGPATGPSHEFQIFKQPARPAANPPRA